MKRGMIDSIVSPFLNLIVFLVHWSRHENIDSDIFCSLFCVNEEEKRVSSFLFDSLIPSYRNRRGQDFQTSEVLITFRPMTERMISKALSLTAHVEWSLVWTIDELHSCSHLGQMNQQSKVFLLRSSPSSSIYSCWHSNVSSLSHTLRSFFRQLINLTSVWAQKGTFPLPSTIPITSVALVSMPHSRLAEMIRHSCWYSFLLRSSRRVENNLWRTSFTLRWTHSIVDLTMGQWTTKNGKNQYRRSFARRDSSIEMIHLSNVDSCFPSPVGNSSETVGGTFFHSRWFFFFFRCLSFRKRLVSTLILNSGYADECFFVLFDLDWNRRNKLLSWRMSFWCLIQCWPI